MNKLKRLQLVLRTWHYTVRRFENKKHDIQIDPLFYWLTKSGRLQLEKLLGERLVTCSTLSG